MRNRFGGKSVDELILIRMRHSLAFAALMINAGPDEEIAGKENIIPFLRQFEW